MKNLIYAGAALAASIAFAQPSKAEPFGAPAAAAMAVSGIPTDAFYAARADRPLWLTNGRANAATSELLNVLRRAQLDGLASGPALAAHAETLLTRASGGDAQAAKDAERLLSAAWVRYVQTLEQRTPGMTYADSWAAPRQLSANQILAAAAAAPSLTHHIADVSAVNPVYAQLRDAAWDSMQATGAAPDRRLLASLDRVRETPFQDRYIIVDAASAKLWMIENGRIVDSMKVITGDAENRTPMVASTIYYATLNPYWNVPEDLVRELIAPRILDQGLSYLTERNYEVLSSYDKNAQVIDPASVDWKAVAAGTTTVKLRRKPGEWNSMGKMKFGFPNTYDIFLHDTPAQEKDKFALEDRNISHGCIRLADARRLGTWLLGHDPERDGDAPEQQVQLPTPVPIYVTYMTAHADNGQIAFADDVYGKDLGGGSMRVAGLR